MAPTSASRALVVALVAFAGCGGSASQASLGGIALYPPRGDQLSVAVNTRYPSSEDDHAADFRRFHWLSVTLAGRTVTAKDASWEVDKTGDVRDTKTFGLSVWHDRWTASFPRAALRGAPARTPLVVRACDRAPAAGVHCERRRIDVCVRNGRLRGEVTGGDPPEASIYGPQKLPGGESYEGDFDCKRPLFNFRALTALAERK